jgi:biotin carboxyl carrier protein
MKLKLRLNGEEREIDVVRQGDRLRITMDDITTECRVVHTDGAAFIIEHDNRQLRAAGLVSGDKRQLWHKGQIISYERVVSGRSSAETDKGALTASIPAVVTEVLVTVGQQVASGDKLILLESMKMVIPIVAPDSGVVTAINCAAGDSVKPGVPLVEVAELIERPTP